MTLTHSGSIVIGASFALVYWSYLPFYALFFIFSSTMLKIQIEVCARSDVYAEANSRMGVYVPGKDDS